jgi:hypothetical protein
MPGDIISEANGHPAFRLKYKGVFDYDKLTTFAIKWLQDRKFEINEKVHKHKMSCPHGFEMERHILGERKIDDYFMHKVEIRFYIWDAFQVDAVKNGEKIKLWNARLEVQLHFDVVCDYSDRWAKTQFMEKLRNKFYDQYIIKREIIIKHADPLYYKLLSLHTKMKNFLEMETGTVF